MAQAEQSGNAEAVAAMQAIGAPPFRDREAVTTLRQWADVLAEGDGDPVQPRPSPLATDYCRDEVPALMKGAEFSRRELHDEVGTVDLAALGLAFEIPFFLFHGTCDQATPIELAEEYFASIRAPHRAFVRFEGCHHFVVMNRPRDVLREPITHLVPHL